jgi:hypothetical protein
MRKGDIIICSRTPNDFYEKILKIGNQYEIMSTDSLPSGPSGSEKVWFNIRCLETNEIHEYLPPYLFISLNDYREFQIKRILD